MKTNSLPLGISVIYFDDKSKNIYADMPTDKEQAKRLAKRRAVSPDLRLIVFHKADNLKAAVRPHNKIHGDLPCIFGCAFLRLSVPPDKV